MVTTLSKKTIGLAERYGALTSTMLILIHRGRMHIVLKGLPGIWGANYTLELPNFIVQKTNPLVANYLPSNSID